jgi:CheY-like chemotaxis protein
MARRSAPTSWRPRRRAHRQRRLTVATLVGRRILLLEDELLVAMTPEQILGAEGCVIVGPFPRVAPGLKAASKEPLDAAVLDINLAAKRVDPIAKALAERKIPFLFATGYDRGVLPAEHADRPTLAKPFQADPTDQWIARFAVMLISKQAFARS